MPLCATLCQPQACRKEPQASRKRLHFVHGSKPSPLTAICVRISPWRRPPKTHRHLKRTHGRLWGTVGRYVKAPRQHMIRACRLRRNTTGSVYRHPMTTTMALKCKHQAGKNRAAARWTGFTPWGIRTICRRGAHSSSACGGKFCVGVGYQRMPEPAPGNTAQTPRTRWGTRVHSPAGSTGWGDLPAASEPQILASRSQFLGAVFVRTSP